MNLFRSFLFMMSAPFLLFTACHDGQADAEKVVADSLVNVSDSLKSDSDVLVLALTPTVDCLPVYYAAQSGIFKTLGLKVNLLTFRSQFDCDTAMLGQTAMGGATDLVRLHHYANEGKYLSAVTTTDGIWRLLVSGKLRIKKTALLKDRMICVARFSASDIYSKAALDAAGMEYKDVFRPQVNDYGLRGFMLKNNQIDAAILPEPFATQARLEGHRVLYTTTDKNGKMGCLAFKPSFLTGTDSLHRVELLLKGYNQAVGELNEKGKSACAGILKDLYRMPMQVIDSLALPKYGKAALPEAVDLAKARSFMEMHNRWNRQAKNDSLINGKFLPK